MAKDRLGPDLRQCNYALVATRNESMAYDSAKRPKRSASRADPSPMALQPVVSLPAIALAGGSSEIGQGRVDGRMPELESRRLCSYW